MSNVGNYQPKGFYHDVVGLLKCKKIELEKRLLAEVNSFENETGLSVKEINYEKVFDTSKPPQSLSVVAEVKGK